MAKQKDSYYFPHDFEPTSDPKIQAFIGEFGAIGYGVYWRLIEMLHSDKDHHLPMEKYIYLSVASQMSVSVEQVEKIIISCVEPYKLFSADGYLFWSERVFRNFTKREEISAKRSKAGKASAKKRAEKEE
jgi:hypothetical protein